MSTVDVICIGSITADTIATVDRLPRDDERLIASDFTTSGGGPAATAAVTLARLGFTVGFCGVIGDDDAGARVRRELEREGVQLNWLQTDRTASTAQSIVLASEATHGRSIVTVEAPRPLWRSVPIGASTWLHADQTGFAAVMRATDATESSQGRPLISVDGGNRLQAGDLRGVDLYVPAVPALLERYPRASLTESLGAAVRDGARRVVATDGARGSHVLAADGSAELVPGFPVDVASTLGAGDVFHGALLGGLIRDLPLEDAVRVANAAAALSCRSVDGRSGIPRVGTLASFLSDAGIVPSNTWPFEMENTHG